MRPRGTPSQKHEVAEVQKKYRYTDETEPFSDTNRMPFPKWAKRRTGEWEYRGWYPKTSPVYEEIRRKTLNYDNERKREIDEYEQGFTEWEKDF